MKKLIVLALVLVLSLSLCGCGGKTMGEEVKGGMTDEHIAMVVDAVKAYMETDAYKKLAAMNGAVTDEAVEMAMHYQADGAVEGINLQVLLVGLGLDGDIVGMDRILVVDLRDGTAYDVYDLDMSNYMGQMDGYEDLMKMAVGGFDNVLNGRENYVMTELEVRTVATDAQLKDINAALAGE